MNVADVIAAACAAHGVQRAFGVPGGGSSLDLIAALARVGIAFVLCRTETGAVLAAAADAEIRNAFGVAITTQGPGAASGMNGLAHASLDRAPVLFISDGWTRAQTAFDTHQVFDQRAMSSAVVKTSTRLEEGDPAVELDATIQQMLAAPWGPSHIELTGENARRAVTEGAPVHRGEARLATPEREGDAAGLLRTARKPVLLVGLEARDADAPQAIMALAQRLQCPLLTTYKGKGIVDDAAPCVVGHFTGGAAEKDCVAAADLIVLCGFDPVELIGRPWPYAAPVVELALRRFPVHYVKPAAGLYGNLASSVHALLDPARPSEWSIDEIATLRAAMAQRLHNKIASEGRLSPQDVVEHAMAAAGPQRPCITVDAGAHMFPAMAFWQAHGAGTSLISNGLASMGFALPAAIARALHGDGTPTIAFIGDGGLMMCAGELATAVQERAKLCVIVFNDEALSLIELKQRSRGMARTGVAFNAVDFAGVARGFGMRAFTATTLAEYDAALRQAFTWQEPCLIDVHVDPAGYAAQARALRG